MVLKAFQRLLCNRSAQSAGPRLFRWRHLAEVLLQVSLSLKTVVPDEVGREGGIKRTRGGIKITWREIKRT